MKVKLMNKEDLKQKYEVEEFSMCECAKLYKVSTKTLRKKLLEYGIRVRGQTEYTTRRRNLLKNNKKLGSKTKSYYDNIKKTGKIPENEIIRREKIGKWSSEFERTEVHKQKISDALVGNINAIDHNVSDETRQKISKALKKRISETGPLSSGMLGKHHSEETKNKLLFSYDKYNLELTNENNKVIGRVLDPIADIAQDKSIYNSQTLASIYYNEKKMVEVLQKFTKMYGKDLDIPSMSTMINGLENKEEVYGNLYIDGSVIRLEFIIK